MKGNKKFFLLAGAFALVLLLATVGYNALSRQYTPENGGMLVSPAPEETETKTQESQAEAEEPEEAAPEEAEPAETDPAAEAPPEEAEPEETDPAAEAAPEEAEPEEAAPAEPIPEEAEPETEETAPAEPESEETEAEPPEPIAAPDFVVVDGDGNEVYLSDFAGKPVVINFWATWCDPCKWELPAFQEMYEVYGEDMVFMMINTADDFRDSVEAVEAFAEENGYTFPIYYDTYDIAAYLYGAFSIPLTAFILPDGMLVGGYRGAIDGNTLEQSIRIVLDLAETSEKVTE